MQRMMAAKNVAHQGSPADAERVRAEATAASEARDMAAKKSEEDDARKRGLRGVRSLFSEAGGFLGFGGKQTLGG